MTEADPVDSVQITVQILNADSTPTSVEDRTFTASLEIASAQQSIDVDQLDLETDPSSTTDDLLTEDISKPDLSETNNKPERSHSLPQVTPLIQECVEGNELSDREIDVWHVPYQYYRLTKVEMWKD